MLTTVPFLASTDEPSDEKPPWLKYGRMHSGRTKRHGKSSLPSAFRAGKPRGAHNLEDVQEYVSTAVERSQYKQAIEMLSPIGVAPGRLQQMQAALDQPGVGAIPQVEVQLDSLVYLGMLKKTGKSAFAAKKLLHPPTLKLFALVEVPILSKEIRTMVAEWVKAWRVQAEIAGVLIHVEGIYWNVPPGCASVLFEYLPGGSFEDLMSATGGLPESALKEAAGKILASLQWLHMHTGTLHGGLKPSQVLLTAAGDVRLSFGLASKVRALTRPRAEEDAGPLNFSKSSPAEAPRFEMDIFDLGMLLLVAAVGGYDVLLRLVSVAEGRRRASSEEFRHATAPAAPANGESTLTVLENELDSGTPRDDDGQQARPGTAGYLPPIDDLMFNRAYSEVFLDFLRLCLESEDKRPTVQELMEHAFIAGDPSAQGVFGPQVGLQELQAVRAALSRAPDGARPGTAGSSADLYMSAVAEAVHAHWSDVEPAVEVAKHNLIYDTHTNLGLSFQEVHAILDGKCQRLRHASEEQALQERAWAHRAKERIERAQRDRHEPARLERPSNPRGPAVGPLDDGTRTALPEV